MKKVYCFTGASGVGKSTLINFISENFNAQVDELSGRQFLPHHASYDQTLTDEMQVLISQNRFLKIIEAILNEINNKVSFVGKIIGSKDDVFVFGRSPIDNIAYQRVLHKGEFLEPILLREIEIFRPYIHYLYIPIEFEMKEKDDVVRGTNSDVQMQVNKHIFNLLKELHLPYDEIHGSIKERCDQLTIILDEFYRIL